VLLDQKATLGERIDANLKNGAQLADQYAALAAARKEIESRLIHADEIAKNLQFFYKLEAETGVKLVDLRQSTAGPGAKPSKSKSFYRSVGYVVAVRGDYVRILDFIRRLESGQRFCRIMTATMGVGAGTEKERASEMTINLNLELLGQP